MIRLTQVSKEFGGVAGAVLGRHVRALEDVTLVVEPGTALGIVGPNGAGKSTLLRLLLGYLHPTRGRLSIADRLPRQYAEHEGIAYVPERVEIPPRWTVRRALEAYAALGDVDHPHERIDDELRRLDIEEIADRRVSALSKGNVQRLALAQALLGDRKLMILDEPTDGLDPEWTARTRDILARWRATEPERVLVFASHNLDEVERIADRVAVLREGKLVEIIEMRSTPDALPPYELVVEGGGGAIVEIVCEIFQECTLTREDGDGLAFRVTARSLPELNRRLALVIERGATIRALIPERPSLEQRFRRSLRRERAVE